MCYAGRQLTNGIVPKSVLGEIAPLKVRTELKTAGLWLEAANDAIRIHDFNEYNPTAEKVREERAKAKQRMRQLRGLAPESEAP
jgi:hypothetical protein